MSLSMARSTISSSSMKGSAVAAEELAGQRKTCSSASAIMIRRCQWIQDTSVSIFSPESHVRQLAAAEFNGKETSPLNAE